MDDLQDFYLMNSDEELMRHIRPPKSFEEAREFLLHNIQFYETHPGLGRWALLTKSNRQVIGSLSLLPLENTNDFHIGYLFSSLLGIGVCI
jgi:ribosomal-protein-alanine N-acetyltransferase